jgi:hypothetical protein
MSAETATTERHSELSVIIGDIIRGCLRGCMSYRLLLITVLAAGAAMELRLDPTPFAWVG